MNDQAADWRSPPPTRSEKNSGTDSASARPPRPRTAALPRVAQRIGPRKRTLIAAVFREFSRERFAPWGSGTDRERTRVRRAMATMRGKSGLSAALLGERIPSRAEPDRSEHCNRSAGECKKVFAPGVDHERHAC